jgi:hypothetical protein
VKVSRSPKSHNTVDYFLLPNGKADVFLHINEATEFIKDEEGNESTVYVAEEAYLRVDQSVTKEQVEANFDQMWNNAENPAYEPTLEERTKSLEDVVLMLMTE